MDKKRRRVNKMLADIDRWRREGNRTATIERTSEDIGDINGQINELTAQHEERKNSVT
jgi:hypothetical protein